MSLKLSVRAAMLATALMAFSQASARTPDAFDIAIDNADYGGAATEIQKLLDRLPAKTAMNPRLDSHYGRYFAAAGQNYVAEPYLVRAVAAERDGAERERLALELARTREARGRIDLAEADYRRLSQAASADPAVRRAATIALARLRLGIAPAEAVALLAPLVQASGGASLWEPHLLLSRAYAMQGHPAESKAALAAAWQEAPSASSPAEAIAVTSMDMALDRAAAGDRAGQAGLISLGKSDMRFTGTAQLPVCGAAVRPEDSVTVAIARDGNQRTIYSAVRASRPGIAHLFTIPLAAVPQFLNGAATYVTLRCRSEPAANVRFAEGDFRDLPSWMAERGLYPPLKPLDPSAGDPLSQLKEQVQALERKVGPDAPVLGPLLLQLAFVQGAQSRFSNAANFAEAKAMAERATRILTAAGAPPEVLEQVRVQMTLAFAQNQNIAAVTGPAALESLAALMARPEMTPRQALTAFTQMSQWRLRPTDRVALADRLLGFFDARHVAADAAERQAVEISRADAMREIGTMAGIRDRLVAHGVSPDLCVSADRAPSIPPTAITLSSDDYPKDLLRRSVAGLTVVELAVAADGKIAGERVIVSQPSGLFDPVTIEKLRTVTLLPAQHGDTPAACRGMLQTVRWQMPDAGDFANPFDSFSTPGTGN